MYCKKNVFSRLLKRIEYLERQTSNVEVSEDPNYLVTDSLYKTQNANGPSATDSRVDSKVTPSAVESYASIPCTCSSQSQIHELCLSDILEMDQITASTTLSYPDLSADALNVTLFPGTSVDNQQLLALSPASDVNNQSSVFTDAFDGLSLFGHGIIANSDADVFSLANCLLNNVDLNIDTALVDPHAVDKPQRNSEICVTLSTANESESEEIDELNTAFASPVAAESPQTSAYSSSESSDNETIKPSPKSHMETPQRQPTVALPTPDHTEQYVRPKATFNRHGEQWKFPIELDYTTILSLGRIVHNYPAFHSPSYIYPVGFKSTCRFASAKSPSDTIQYCCAIVSGIQMPIFQVYAPEDVEIWFTGVSPDFVWTQVLKSVLTADDGRKRSGARLLKGDENAMVGRGHYLFGLDHPQVKRMIEELPKARLCKQYDFEDSQLLRQHGQMQFDSPFFGSNNDAAGCDELYVERFMRKVIDEEQRLRQEREFQKELDASLAKNMKKVKSASPRNRKGRPRKSSETDEQNVVTYTMPLAAQPFDNYYKKSTVTLKSREVVTFPHQVGNLTIHSLGKIVSNPQFYATNIAYPVGFVSSRLLQSYQTPRVSVRYYSSVLEVDGQPRFQVEAEDDPGNLFVDGSLYTVWKEVSEAIHEACYRCHTRYEGDLNGFHTFGFNVPTVSDLIHGLSSPRMDVEHDTKPVVIARKPMALKELVSDDPSSITSCSYASIKNRELKIKFNLGPAENTAYSSDPTDTSDIPSNTKRKRSPSPEIDVEEEKESDSESQMNVDICDTEDEFQPEGRRSAQLKSGLSSYGGEVEKNTPRRRSGRLVTLKRISKRISEFVTEVQTPVRESSPIVYDLNLEEDFIEIKRSESVSPCISLSESPIIDIVAPIRESPARMPNIVSALLSDGYNASHFGTSNSSKDPITIYDVSPLDAGVTKNAQQAMESIVIQPLPTNPNGTVMLPIRLEAVTVYNLGKIVSDRPLYHRKECFYPIGYRSSTYYCSVDDCTKKIRYLTTIIQGGSSPIFQISSDDENVMVYRGRTPLATWESIENDVRENCKHGNKDMIPKIDDLTSLEYLGLTHPNILQLLQDLPNAEKCSQYEMKSFEIVSASRDSDSCSEGQDHVTNHEDLDQLSDAGSTVTICEEITLRTPKPRSIHLPTESPYIEIIDLDGFCGYRHVSASLNSRQGDANPQKGRNLYNDVIEISDISDSES